ncbi:MAG: lipid II flippase MurJ, partial [Patescibacteria group bacterium]|nr:lipid II flippase MurJ [Patescibacteria group bacterium]
VILGAALHLGIQIPTVLAGGFFKSFPRTQPFSSLSGLVSISVPRALALSMSQLSFLGLVGLAGILSAGSISIFMFSYNLHAAPLAIIGASYSVAAFPRLAQMFSRGERDEFLTHVSTAARHIFFWSCPAIALIIVLRAYIVRLVLGSGAFDWTDTRLTAAALALLSISLAAQALTLLLVRGYYAAGRTMVPFLMSAVTAAAALGLGFLFINVVHDPLVLRAIEIALRVRGVAGSQVLALPFAYSLTALMGALFLSIHFNRTFPGFFSRTARTFTESVAAGLAGGLAAYIAVTLLGDITPLSTTLGVFVRGLAGAIAGLSASALAYHVIGSEEF